MFWLGSNSLSLLIALVAVLGSVVPVVKIAFTREYEHVTARVVSQRYQKPLGNVLVILLSNDGTASAFVEPQATLFSNRRKSAFSVDLLPNSGSSSNQGEGLATLLLTRSSQRVLFAALPDRAPMIAHSEPSADCELVVSVHKLDGTERAEVHKYRCFDWNALGPANRNH